jgi:alcohol dehydrogenase (cytochrome c)
VPAGFGAECRRSFQTSQLWKASPMTYVFDNQQYVAVAAGTTVIAFGLR